MSKRMQHQFSQVPKADIPRSSFNRTHGHKTTFNAGYLVPVFVDEALPGDTFNLKMTAFARLATPIVPFMDNLYCDSFFFFVPNRLIWNNWQKFNGEQTDPDDSTDFTVPEITSPVGGYAVGSIYDYFGLPTGIAGVVHNALHARAYSLIWNEWFRDQNMQDSVLVNKDDGPDAPGECVLLRRGKRHDYFTSCLPWPQKGPTVPLIGVDAPVRGLGKYNQTFGGSQSVYDSDGTTSLFAGAAAINTAAGNNTTFYVEEDPSNPGFPSLRVDLTNESANTINSLRQSFQIQKLYERDARGGTRYTEILKAHFGVTSPDARLQRPEYLGGGSSPIRINPVTQTSSTDATTPQGNLAAFGVMTQNGSGFTKSFTEHGVIIGLVSVRADLNYQQGLNRMWSRQTRFDFYWPALSHIGEQAVLNKEIYTQATADDELVFGYQERYAEYRYKPSQITGLFRSQAASSLDIWHLAQEFSALPTLNSTFIQENPPLDRVSAVPSEPHLLADFHFDYKCARPMPVYSVPGLIDHF